MNKYIELCGRIKLNENEIFTTKNGIKFTYIVEKNSIRPCHVKNGEKIPINRLIGLSDIAYAYLNCDKILKPSDISKINSATQGQSYVFGIIKDHRIAR